MRAYFSSIRINGTFSRSSHAGHVGVKGTSHAKLNSMGPIRLLAPRLTSSFYRGASFVSLKRFVFSFFSFFIRLAPLSPAFHEGIRDVGRAKHFSVHACLVPFAASERSFSSFSANDPASFRAALTSSSCRIFSYRSVVFFWRLMIYCGVQHSLHSRSN